MTLTVNRYDPWLDVGFKAGAPCYFSHPPIFIFDRGADINLRPGKISAQRSARVLNSELPE
jgi:hypothetical protein